MEPLSAGASVLAFVGIALDSTKSLYNIVSSFIHAGQETQSLVSAIDKLKRLLRQLQRCRALSEANTDVRDLRNLLAEYNEDVAGFKRKLGNIMSTQQHPGYNKS